MYIIYMVIYGIGFMLPMVIVKPQTIRSILSRHWWRITRTFGHARSSAWPSCGSRDFHVACRAVWRTPQLSLRWGLTTYGPLQWNLGVLAVRCFGFGMSLRRMANLKAMEFCVGKKKDTVLCWKQDFWQDGLPLGFTSPLSTTARPTCQNPEKQQKKNQNSCPSNCCLPSSNPT